MSTRRGLVVGLALLVGLPVIALRLQASDWYADREWAALRHRAPNRELLAARWTPGALYASPHIGGGPCLAEPPPARSPTVGDFGQLDRLCATIGCRSRLEAIEWLRTWSCEDEVRRHPDEARWQVDTIGDASPSAFDRLSVWMHRERLIAAAQRSIERPRWFAMHGPHDARIASLRAHWPELRELAAARCVSRIEQ